MSVWLGRATIASPSAVPARPLVLGDDVRADGVRAEGVRADDVPVDGIPAAGAQADVVPAIRLRGLRKSFGQVDAVAGVDLDIRDGEFLCLLGPSGSGKTTILRMIAGFETPTAGVIELAGKDVTRTPPFDRDVNTVFQDYALFPHMTVSQNVEYGLRVKGVGRAERRTRAQSALTSVALAEHGSRKPAQLSGGQRQRVALARALVNRPRVLLLDEPLGALDLKLRQQMQLELKRMQREAGITFVFVTHDQEEALTMSDRIAVINAGQIEQLGAPREVYENPGTRFVATFLGTTNIIEGAEATSLFGQSGTYTLRPERISIRLPDEPAPAGHRSLEGIVHDVIYAGSHVRILLTTGAGPELTVTEPGPPASAAAEWAVGDRVAVSWAADRVTKVR